MNFDLVQLVVQSMEEMGCGGLVDQHLDPHSPICIGFHSVPDMYVEHRDDQVLLWSQQRDIAEPAIAHVAADLMTYLLPRSSADFIGGRPLLSLMDGRLMLHGTLSMQALEGPEAFSGAIQSFFEDLCAIDEILGR